jgi:hypothetical protein
MSEKNSATLARLCTLAPTHVLAEMLSALERDGWRLVRMPKRIPYSKTPEEDSE